MKAKAPPRLLARLVTAVAVVRCSGGNQVADTFAGSDRMTGPTAALHSWQTITSPYAACESISTSRRPVPVLIRKQPISMPARRPCACTTHEMMNEKGMNTSGPSMEKRSIVDFCHP